MNKSFDKKGNYIPGQRIPEMIDEKYYTPKVEEFHVGFEYEISYTIGSANGKKHIHPDFLPLMVSQGYWDKRIFSTTDAVDVNIPHDLFINYENNNRFFRVKYLDKEDIELFGFKLRDEMNCTWTKEYIDPRQIDNKVDLIYNNGTNHLLICLGSDETCYSDWKTIFTGFIKNKSELKVLLKQLNILT